MSDALREYQAFILKDGESQVWQRAQTLAKDLHKARAKLEAEFGEGTVRSLWNDEDADRPR